MVTKKQPVKLTTRQRFVARIKRLPKAIKNKSDDYLARRPHRSFRRTRRRDYVRSLQLPGYFAFTSYVRKTLWANRRTFFFLALVYIVLTIIMVGIASQDTYNTITDTVNQSSGNLFNGNFGAIGKAGIVLFTAVAGGLSTNSPGGAQQAFAGIIVLLTWLTTVWILRNVLAGHKVKLRDGLYNASAPLLSTFLVAGVLILELIPVAIAALGYSAAVTTGLLSGGIEAMLFWIAAILLVLISLYLVTSTFIALVVVTLPGMYPLQALRTAGDLVIGRRSRILLRMLWLGLSVVIGWIVVMIPIIMFDGWIKGVWSAISWVPIVPVTILSLSALTLIWASSYIYLLYRRIVADDAAPA